MKNRNHDYVPIPPTALVTETAAVKIPSAIVRPVPKRAWESGSHKAHEVAVSNN
jgi:hypothetical protein